LIVSFLGGNIAMPYLDGVSIHNLLRGFPSASFASWEAGAARTEFPSRNLAMSIARANESIPNAQLQPCPRRADHWPQSVDAWFYSTAPPAYRHSCNALLSTDAPLQQGR